MRTLISNENNPLYLEPFVKKILKGLNEEVADADSIGSWFLAKEGEQYRVKRHVRRGRKRTFQRFPSKHYKRTIPAVASRENFYDAPSNLHENPGVSDC
ncbi:MAG: hypothetical protein H6618_00145 [Deltaproteobacteria bacterium]|nr:hypothetical protein [Deltaproteobacteria bacterium]